MNCTTCKRPRPPASQKLRSFRTTQLILEEALEAEVRDEVGRERYERADGAASGYRNGCRTGRMKRAEGMVAMMP